MNLTDAADIKVNGKEVQQIKIDGNIVYTAGYRIRITTDKTYILTGETATLTVKCEDLPFTQIELYNVIDMVQTKIADLTTDSNGQATYTYTGDGSGEIGFLAKYDGKESNRVIIDDYIPVYHPVLSRWSSNITYGHAPTGLLVAARDQHDERGPNGVTIVFKEGDTVLDTIVTAGSTPGTIGTATFDLNSLDVGVHTIYAMIGSTSSTSTATITVNKANTSLDISVPVLVYSDNFSVTGVLKDSYNTPLSGARVRLKWNVGDNEYSATATTNASGEVTFATQAPTSITDYTFQLEYDGNTNYNASASSVIQRTVGKETSVLVVTSPVSGAVVSTDSVVVSGTATDDDNTPLTGKIVYLFINDSYAGTTTVGSDGSFSKTISGLSAGSNSIRCEIVATTTHTAARQVITVNRSTFDGLSLSKTAGKQILSFADKTTGSENTEFCTVTAQLMNGQSTSSISDIPIEFYVDGTLVDTVDTDGNGSASYTYVSQGLGDITISAKVSASLIQTFVIKDANLYDDASSNKSSRYTTKLNNPSLTYSTDHYILTSNKTGNFNSVSPTSIDSSTDWQIEVDMYSTNIMALQLFNTENKYVSCTLYPNNGNVGVYDYGNGGGVFDVQNVGLSRKWYHVTIKIVQNNLYLIIYDGDTEIFNQSGSLPSSYQNTTLYPSLSSYWSDTPLSFKNLLIKPL